MELLHKREEVEYDGLNPYYNGRYSWSMCKTCSYLKYNQVLILIIMEDTHGVAPAVWFVRAPVNVLILIIMEDTHGESRHISP